MKGFAEIANPFIFYSQLGRSLCCGVLSKKIHYKLTHESPNNGADNCHDTFNHLINSPLYLYPYFPRKLYSPVKL